MNDLPIAEWLDALDRMEASLKEALAGNDRYEAAFAPVLDGGSAAAIAAVAEGLLATVDDRVAEHDRGLAAAAGTAQSVDRLMSEREAETARWRGALSRWNERIQRGWGGAAVDGPRTPGRGP